MKRPREETPPEPAECTPEASTNIDASSSPSVELNPFTNKPYSANYYQLLQSRQNLPIYSKMKEIQDTVRQHPVTLLVGETGSGKTTQVPQFLAAMREEFPGLVACTQPRRIAAISVAQRVASEMDVGGTDGSSAHLVGYHVRFQSTYAPGRTKVLFLTDGMLLRAMTADAGLSQYSVVIVDEAHERTISTDVLLGLLKQLLSAATAPPRLRVVIMSATLELAKIRGFFPGAPLLQVSGRTFPVSVTYVSEPVTDYVEAAVRRAVSIHHDQGPGDVLCFLTGEWEIERAVSATRIALGAAETAATTEALSGKDVHNQVDPHESTPRPDKAVVLPFYGTLPLPEQQKVFRACPPDTRKIVFATNAAETSVTIDGVVFVVDCGYQKQKLYDPDTRVDRLLPAVISKASAEQRAGRAGRTKPGHCYRLYTAKDYHSLFPPQTHPEILRTSKLTNVLLLLLKLGVANPMTFPFVDAPPQETVADAFYQLLYYGAVDGELRLTPLGAQMAELPIDVTLARMLVRAPEYGCAADAAVVAAMLETGEVFAGGSGGGSSGGGERKRTPVELRDRFARGYDGDHVVLFFVFHAFYKCQKPADAESFCRENGLRLSAMQHALLIYRQLRGLLGTHKIEARSTYDEAKQTVNSVALQRAILEGFFLQTAWRAPRAGGRSPKYVTVRDAITVVPHERSLLNAGGGAEWPQWIVFDKLEMHSSLSSDVFFRVATAVDVAWLLEVSDFFQNPTEISNREIAYALTLEKQKKEAGRA